MKREKVEGVDAKSVEKKPELEPRTAAVTKLPSNVQPSHNDVKKETVQPAQPAQPHHRLNVVEGNGKPWYEEPNISRLLYRQHQLVSRFVGNTGLRDE